MGHPLQAAVCEEFQPFIATLQHRQRADRAGQQATWSNHGHAGQPLHRPASEGIDNVAKTPAIHFQATFVIPAGGKPAPPKGQSGNHTGAAGVAHADAPRAAIRMRPEDVQIATKVDIAGLNASGPQQ